MAKTRILHIIDSLTIGGAEKILTGTINHLSDFDHHLVYLGGSDALVKDLPPDCKVTSLNFRSKIDLPGCIFSLRNYIRQNNIDLIHSHLVLASLVAKIACPRNLPLFITLHSLVGSRFFGPGKLLARMAERITYKKRHHIIAVSEEVYRDYDYRVGIKGDYSILPNFVEDLYFQQQSKKMNFDKRFSMIAVGNLKPAKNYHFLIEAFKKFSKNIYLDIYGDGPLEKELEEEIFRYKLNIKLCGLSNNIAGLMQNYDLFVMCSIFEGHPLALLEAMASGMPAATSDISVLREATRNKGIYFNLSDVDDFVNKINTIVDHQVNLDEYAEHNLALAKKVATRAIFIKSLTRIYRNKKEINEESDKKLSEAIG